MSDSGAGPSKPPLPGAKKLTYLYGKKELDAPAYADALRTAKARGSATWWSAFSMVLLDGVVKLKCLVCGDELGAKNPSATAPTHLKKHQRAASKVTETVSTQLSSNDGEEEESARNSQPSGLKRSRSYDGGPMRSFLANSSQVFVFLKNLALFFYTTNTALHLIENPYLVKACAAVGITLPSRKKLHKGPQPAGQGAR